MDAARRFVVRGVVQGVGFRWFVLQRARRHGVAGWVRNRPDGSVEVLAQGAAVALEALADDLAAGPGRSRVTAVEREDLPGDPRLAGFDIH